MERNKRRYLSLTTDDFNIENMANKALTMQRLASAGVGSVFRPQDLAPLGISFLKLQMYVDSGEVEKIARGLYRLTGAEITEFYSLAAVCARIPQAIKTCQAPWLS